MEKICTIEFLVNKMTCFWCSEMFMLTHMNRQVCLQAKFRLFFDGFYIRWNLIFAFVLCQNQWTVKLTSDQLRTERVNSVVHRLTWEVFQLETFDKIDQKIHFSTTTNRIACFYEAIHAMPTMKYGIFQYIFSLWYDNIPWENDEKKNKNEIVNDTRRL